MSAELKLTTYSYSGIGLQEGIVIGQPEKDCRRFTKSVILKTFRRLLTIIERLVIEKHTHYIKDFCQLGIYCLVKIRAV